MSDDHDYSEIADQQLDLLEKGPDAQPYNAVLDASDLILSFTGEALKHSGPVRMTNQGLLRELPVNGYPTRVFWSVGPPARGEARGRCRRERASPAERVGRRA